MSDGRLTPNQMVFKAYSATRKALRGESTCAASDVACSTGSLVDRLIEGVHQELAGNEGRKVACAQGCWFCCTQRITVTVPEVIHLARHIRERFSREEIHNLLERLRQYNAKVEPLQGQRRIHRKILCPLNVNGHCSVYEARPLVCRGYASFDVDVCRENAENQEQRVAVPTVEPQLDAAGAVLAGILQACTDSKLAMPELEFMVALEHALTAEGLEERWLAGEQVLSEAVDPEAQRQAKLYAESARR